MRNANLLVWLQSVGQDVRFATSLMRRRPAFTMMAILLLGLGIGASTGIFSLLRRTDSRQPWGEWKTMQRLIDESESMMPRRPLVGMLGAFGLLALMLATVGLYAVLSYSVTERTREIGIRLALGGQRARLATHILRDALRMAIPAMCVGLAVAYELSSLLPSGHIGWSGSGVFLYGVTRMDAAPYIGVVLLLIGVSIFATLWPARRALRVDPVIALRHE